MPYVAAPRENLVSCSRRTPLLPPSDFVATNSPRHSIAICRCTLWVKKISLLQGGAWVPLHLPFAAISNLVLNLAYLLFIKRICYALRYPVPYLWFCTRTVPVPILNMALIYFPAPCKKVASEEKKIKGAFKMQCSGRFRNHLQDPDPELGSKLTFFKQEK